MIMYKDELLLIIKKNGGKILGVILGLIIALCILFIGVFKTIFIVFAIFLGYYIGSKFDSGESYDDFFNNLLLPWKKGK